MSQPQCHSVKSPAICTALQAPGLPNNIQRYVVSGPLSQIGLNNGTIYGAQGKNSFCAIMDHIGITTNTGHHMRDLIDYHNLEIGCLGSLFANNFQALYHSITPYWIAHTCQFMHENDLAIGETTVHILTQKQNELFIM